MKGKLLLLLSFITFGGYAQLQTEGFEDTAEMLPVGWQQINLDGFDNWWKISETGNPARPPFEGDHAAYLVPDISTGTTEDWLVTPQFIVPENAQLKFYSRLFQEGDQGSVYRVMIHAGNTPSVTASYTELQQWTELQINPTQLVYNEIVVPIPAAYMGQAAYIAFVINGGGFSDGWLVDDVGVYGIMKNFVPERTANIQLYPNPVKDLLTIKFTDTEVTTVEVIDNNGRQCIVAKHNDTIDMSSLAAGLYFVKISTPDGVETRKVVKE